MPIPTTSPACNVSKSIFSRVSSTSTGSPNSLGVAPASTYSQRGVITAVPKETSLGLTRWTFICGLASLRQSLGKHMISGTHFPERGLLLKLPQPSHQGFGRPTNETRILYLHETKDVVELFMVVRKVLWSGQPVASD